MGNAGYNGQQMTFEARTVQDGDQRIADRAQLAQIKSLKPDQMVHVNWTEGHGGHYTITEMRVGPADGARQGLIRGTVITADDSRVVVAKDEGGQMTLEATVFWRWGTMLRDPFQKLACGEIRAGEKVTAIWEIGEGMHYILRGIATDDPTDDALGSVLLQAQLRESYNQINQLQNEIRQLKNLVNQVLKQIEGEG